MGLRETLSEEWGTRVYNSVAIDVADILVGLFKNDRCVTNDSGAATQQLLELIGYEKGRPQLGNLLTRLADSGYLTIDRRNHAKRTYAIRLADRWDEVRAQAYEVTRLTSQAAEIPSGARPTPETHPEKFEEGEADILGARPGRLAARIEKTIPEIVSNAVQDAIDSRIGLMLGALGYFQSGVTTEQYEALSAEHQRATDAVNRLVEVNRQLGEEVKAEQAAAMAARTELNQLLRSSNAGQAASSRGLMVSEVPMAFRDNATWALANGWTILRTRGGHLLWKHANGSMVFSASTPSDSHAPANLRRDLERATT